MSELGASRDALLGRIAGSNNAAPSGSESQPLTDSNTLLKIIGTVASQAALITALLYYFGWARSSSFLDYFGIDTSLVNYSTGDYLLRSINVAFPPFIYTVFASLILLAIHRLVIDPALARATYRLPPAPSTSSNMNSLAIPRAARLESNRMVSPPVGWATVLGHWRSGGRFRQFIAILQGAAVFLGAVVLVGLLLPAQVGAPLGVILPLLLIVSVSLLIYIAHLRSRYLDALAPANGFVPQSRMYILLLWVLELIACLWAASIYGKHVGTRLAMDMVSQLAARPKIVVYSTDRIALGGPGILVDPIETPGTKYHYQYAGLRLLIHSSDKYLLLPSGWQHRRDRVLILPDNESIRVDVMGG